MQSPLPDAYDPYTQGVALYESRRYEAALDRFVESSRLDPSFWQAHWNECVTRLILGDFKNGWPLHEARWQKNEGRWEPDPAKRGWRHLAQPLWVGDFPIEGKVVCLWGEQGFGDTLQFCRYAPIVQAMGAQVFLYVRAALAPLLRHSYARHGIAVVADHEPLPAFDAHCPLMSLPLACGTDSVSNIPAPTPYIFADDQQVALWGQRLAERLGTGRTSLRRVGLVWSGMLRSANPEAVQMDALRSLDFSLLEPLLTLDNVAWVSLQKDAQLSPDTPLVDITADLQDWAQTAALVANLDMVIACDTAVAHLAAAMGRPTWILSRWNGCWRWLDHRPDSPWYPTVRLFHQPAPGDWSSVVQTVRDELALLR